MKVGFSTNCCKKKTLAYHNDHRKGTKRNMERITVLFTCSMEGEKYTPFVIGKSKMPRCMKNVRNLPVKYDANKSAWMTSVLFSEWLHGWNSQLKAQRRKICLLMDNCTGMVKKSGPWLCKLSNLKLPLAAGASSHNLGPTFLTISVQLTMLTPSLSLKSGLNLCHRTLQVSSSPAIRGI